MTLDEKQSNLIDTINETGDCFDQYALLLVKAQELPQIPDERMIPEALVRGCQSRVWFYLHEEDKKVYMDADSDTLILRGVLAILKELIDGESMEEVADLEIRIFEETELGATFTSDRNTGVRTIIKKIQEFCR